MSETTMNPRRRRIGGWSHFPIWLTIAMGLVFAVNARFIYVAVTTFPSTRPSRSCRDLNHGRPYIYARWWGARAGARHVE